MAQQIFFFILNETQQHGSTEVIFLTWLQKEIKNLSPSSLHFKHKSETFKKIAYLTYKLELQF